MTNWLESEENKRKEDSLKNRVKYDRLKSLDDNLKKNLISFFDLCERVNALGKRDIKINETGASGINFCFTVYSPDNTGGYSGGTYLYYERVIKFIYREDPERLEVDVFFEEQLEQGSMRQKYPYRLYNKSGRLLYRKEINIEDIIIWDEEKKLNCIKWLIGETDTGEPFSGHKDKWKSYYHWLYAPIESLPGKSNVTPVFDYKLQLDKLEKDLISEKNTLVELNKWQLFRSEREKKNQIFDQETKIKKIESEIRYLG